MFKETPKRTYQTMILNNFDVKVVFLVELGASHMWDAGCERVGFFHNSDTA